MVVERGPQGADPAVHHVARSDDVGTGLGLGDRSTGEKLERQVVVDLAVLTQDAAVPVACVLAQAEVGDDQEIGMLGLDRARGGLDDPLVVPCP